MRTAPIQLSQVSFRRVSVEVDAARVPEDGAPLGDVSLDLDRVNILTDVSFAPAEEVEGPGICYFLALRVVINNETSDDKDVRFSPYLIDIEAGAVVHALPGSEVLGNVEDLVVVNGTSLLWSAIREQVCNLTARMPAGMVMLPTVNFHDLKRQNREKEAEVKVAPKRKPKPAKKTASSKKA